MIASFLFNKIRQQSFFLFFLLSLAVAIWIFWPMHNLQAPLSQGDHGKDLYAFQQTAQGQIPMRDYWWIYGPLMPYYYGFFFRLFGASIQHVLLAEIFLKVCAAGFFYLALTRFFPALFAFSSAAWLCKFYPHFNYTYTHSGGVVILMMLMYLLFSYVCRPHPWYRYLIFFTVILLAFVKINFGILSLGLVTISLPVIDRWAHRTQMNLGVYGLLFLLSCCVIGLGYLAACWGLPAYAIRQCLPYFSANASFHAPLAQTLLRGLRHVQESILSSWYSRGLAASVIFSCCFILVRQWRYRKQSLPKEDVFWALGLAAVFLLAVVHEFILSGALHRLEWAKPFQILVIFLIMGWALRGAPKILSVCFCLALLGLVIHDTAVLHRAVNMAIKVPTRRLALGKNAVYLTNPSGWIRTVSETVTYLNAHLEPTETFFALPYDALYYFLTNRRSPVWELQFFREVGITPEQEARMIATLEKKNIRYILLSSRCNSPDLEFGRLGQTHGMLLTRYLSDRFHVVTSFGDWDGTPVWVDHHGTMIFKRNENPR